MNHLKPFFNASFLSLMLLGCTNSSNTTQQKPLEINTLKIPKTVEQKQHEQPIIAYFSPEAAETSDFENTTRLEAAGMGYSTVPVKNGYYRKLLDRDQNGRYLVQDFFQESDKKQTDPYWIKEVSALKSFDGKATDGIMIAYHENGNIQIKHHYKDFKQIGKNDYYYKNGQIAFADDIISDQLILQKIWYENGKLAADLKINPSNNNCIFDSKVWDERGRLVTDSEKIDQILAKLHSYF
ncbi:toxin-antitoxin system YwqK family antitoxin [Acinetobacter sp. CFCC 10889]|uniref:toxin-antitoxin system YwqK family antitoxin n=1 Tax=Acinetobacter sp. CFCC 10889 TaxID=1775557 RepID=UPI000DD05B31|nr:membrane-binding protein [Acinetobacter sp. CFCC 10889]